MTGTSYTGPLKQNGRHKIRGQFDGALVGFEPDWYSRTDDFDGIVLDATNDWTVVKDSGAAVALAADTAMGVVNLTSAATTDDDGASIQGNEIFLVTAGKRMWFNARAKLSAAADMDFCLGLTVNFATNPEAMLTAADRIVFQVNDGDASILCKTEKSGTETSTDSGVDMVDDTYVEFGILIDGTTKVEFYVNKALVATHTANIVDDELLTVAAMSLSGSATGTMSSSLDYVAISAER